MFDAEWIDRISSLATRAAEPKVVRLDDLQRIVAHHDKLEFSELPPPAKCRRMQDLESLMHWAKEPSSLEPAVVYHAPHRVVAVRDHDGHERDRAVLELRPARWWRAIEHLGGQQMEPLAQRDLIALLREDLQGSLDDQLLLPSVRSLTFSQSQEGHSVVGNDASKLGRSIEGRVTGTERLPDEFTVSGLIYQSLPEALLSTVSVRIALEVRHQDVKFRLALVGDDLDDALRATHDTLHRFLVANVGQRVYYGQPS